MTGHSAGTFDAPWLSELTDHVAAAKRDDPMAPVTVLVPTNIAGIVARRHLARGFGGGRHGVAAIWFTTVPRLAEQLAAAELHAMGRRPATSPILAATTRSILTDNRGAFDEVAEHPATVRAIVRAHRELSEVDDDGLASIAAGSTLTADVVRVHQELRGRLRKAWYEKADLLEVAAQRLTTDPSVADTLGTLIDYLPRDRSPLEERLVTRLSEVRTIAHVYPPATFDELDPAAYADRVLTASDSDDEVRTVVRDVIAALHSIPTHRLAILYTDRAPYARLLHDQLTAAGITINGAGTRPVVERAVPRVVLGLLETARTGWHRTDLMRTLGEAPLQQFTGERVPQATWERVSRDAAVVHESDWADRLETFRDAKNVEADAADYESRRNSAGRSAAQADELRAFVAALRERLEAIDSSASWGEAAQRLSDLVDALLPESARHKMPLEEQYAAGALDRAVSALAAVDSSSTPPSLASVEDALLLDLENALPRVGRFGEGVYVGPLSEAVGQSVDRLFVVGMSEDLCPGRLHDDSLLPDRVRASAAGQLRRLKERTAQTERDLVSAFRSAPDVTATFARGDLRKQTTRLPSRWLMPTLRALSGDPLLPATQYQRGTGDGLTHSPSYAGGISSTDAPATKQEWRLRAVLSGERVEGAPLEAHRALVDGRSGSGFSPYDGNLSGADGLPIYFDSADRTLSASALETYATCPHAWFVSRQLSIEPIEEPELKLEISAMDLGNIVHESFDRWVREYAAADQLPGYGEPWTPDQRARLAQVGGDVADEHEAQGKTGHPRTWKSRRDQLLTTLVAMVDEDNEWRAMYDAKVVASEVAFGMKGSDTPLHLETSRGIVRFRGSIDKLDETRSGTLLVTDIKTGKKKAFASLSEVDPVAAGTKLQLPLYAHAARQHAGRPDSDVRAAYWFVLRDSGRVDLPLSDSVAATYDDTVGTLVESMQRGVYPQRAPETRDYLWTQCPYCNPDGIGHAESRQRWEQLRELDELHDLVRIIEPDIAARAADSSKGAGDE